MDSRAFCDDLQSVVRSARETLVLLTAGFPFGIESEPFLEAEIEVLAEKFSRILVLPSHRDRGVRPLPPNVTLVEMGWLDEPSREASLRALRSRSALRVLLHTLRTWRNWWPYLAASRMYLAILANNVIKYRMLADFVRRQDVADAIFYDYWFENSTLALALLRRSGLISRAVSRAHRFDLDDESWDGRPVPFREFKAWGLDLVFPVSEFASGYMRKRIPALQGKVRVCRLGVRRQGEGAAPRSDTPLVLSCSRLLPRKRVHLIPEVLSRLGRPLRWVHLGDGPERYKVEAAAGGIPANVRCELLGQVSNNDVLGFYQSHHVDVLLSLSEAEGLPVSMMEALSFGTPIVASAVHGVPEIVNPTTGVLLDPRATVDHMAEGLAAALEPGRFDPSSIRAFFSEHFEAGRNFGEFADILLTLGKSPR